jgi:hypothetical protein
MGSSSKGSRLNLTVVRRIGAGHHAKAQLPSLIGDFLQQNRRGSVLDLIEPRNNIGRKQRIIGHEKYAVWDSRHRA